MIGICKEKTHIEARGMCINCYGRWKYYNVLDLDKYKKWQKKWRKDNREHYNTYMRNYMRKRLNVKNPRKFKEDDK